MEVIGSNNSLHFDIADSQSDNLIEINIWWANVLLTPIESATYLPQFINSLRYEMGQLVNKQINSDGYFLKLGPTTDDCSFRIKVVGDSAFVSFEVEDSEIHSSTIQVAELIFIYSKIIDRLEQLNV